MDKFIRTYMLKDQHILGIFTTIITVTFIFGVKIVIGQQLSSPDLEKSEPVDTKSEISTSIIDISEEEIIPETYSWRGLASEPKIISLPTIGKETFVESSGIDLQTNEIDVPTNTNLTGWFNQSALPGEPGLSIISGHYDGPTKEGIFLYLHKLTPTDTFTIEKGDGTVLTYEVVKVFDIEADKAVNYLFSQESDISSQLNLITCGGGFNYDSQRYTERTIVVSKLI